MWIVYNLTHFTSICILFIKYSRRYFCPTECGVIKDESRNMQGFCLLTAEAGVFGGVREAGTCSEATERKPPSNLIQVCESVCLKPWVTRLQQCCELRLLTFWLLTYFSTFCTGRHLSYGVALEWAELWWGCLLQRWRGAQSCEIHQIPNNFSKFSVCRTLRNAVWRPLSSFTNLK
jgi:hypothetical protein